MHSNKAVGAGAAGAAGAAAAAPIFSDIRGIGAA